MKPNFFKHPYRILLIITLTASLIMLGWWANLFLNILDHKHQDEISNLIATTRMASFILGKDDSNEPQPGLYPEDTRIKISHCNDPFNPLSVRLKPSWSQYCVSPTHSTLVKINETYLKSRSLAIKEMAILIFFILLFIFILYRLTKMEREQTKDTSEFWSRLTHEIKTPITGLKIFLETLKTKEFTKAEIQPLVDLALKQIERQESLAENMIIGQRLSQGGSGLHLEKIDIVRIILELAEGHKKILSQQTIIVQNHLESPTWVLADQDALHAIFDNLINNAIKYSGPDLIFKIDLSLKNKKVHIVFLDNGQGFDPKLSDLIFKPYKRLPQENTHSHRGTGMGLYISLQLAHKMGGDLVGSSQGSGQGSSLTLTLPRTDP